MRDDDFSGEDLGGRWGRGEGVPMQRPLIYCRILYPNDGLLFPKSIGYWTGSGLLIFTGATILFVSIASLNNIPFL